MPWLPLFIIPQRIYHRNAIDKHPQPFRIKIPANFRGIRRLAKTAGAFFPNKPTETGAVVLPDLDSPQKHTPAQALLPSSKRKTTLGP